MPLYEYQCESCGQRFEIRQSFKDEPLTVCPRCGGPIHRLIQAPAIVFKGSGFYATDHKGGNGNGVKKDKTETTSPASETKAAETTTTPSTEPAKSETPKAAPSATSTT